MNILLAAVIWSLPLSVSISVLDYWLSLVFIIAILAIVFGMVANRKTGYSRNMATVDVTGLVLGVIEISLSFISLVGFACK